MKDVQMMIKEPRATTTHDHAYSKEKVPAFARPHLRPRVHVERSCPSCDFNTCLHVSCGQATLEYMFVMLGFLAILFALGAFVHKLGDSEVLQQLANASSHTSDQGFMGGLQDLLLY